MISVNISLDLFVLSYIHSFFTAGVHSPPPCFHSWPLEALHSQISFCPWSEPTVKKGVDNTNVPKEIGLVISFMKL